jgi:hypothetical protein
MVHSDAQTRVGAHNIFGTVVIPASAWHAENCTSSVLQPLIENVKKYLSTSASKFSSIQGLLETFWKDHRASKQLTKTSTTDKFIVTESNQRDVSTLQNKGSSKTKQIGPAMELELTANNKEIVSIEPKILH